MRTRAVAVGVVFCKSVAKLVTNDDKCAPIVRIRKIFFQFLLSENGVAFACVYNASGRWGQRRLLFAANPSHEDAEIDLGVWAEREWTQIADHERFLDASDRTWANAPDKKLFVPAIGCGLWESLGGR